MYSLLRPLLFSLSPETAHHVSLTMLKWLNDCHCLRTKQVSQPVTYMGLNFPNRIGLAAGLDKNGVYIEALSQLGFGFIEIGTVTPRPQAGNPKPRLFRLPADEAIINRLGFNNLGMDFVYEQVKRTNFQGILGINIGKNRSTPNHEAIQDYVTGFRKLAPLASYITINISSPNTQYLRDLQAADTLTLLLKALKNEQTTLADCNRYVPLVVKISPDMNENALAQLAEVLLEQQVDGAIVANTTLLRDELHLRTKDPDLRHQTGGLSGRPLLGHSTGTLSQIKSIVKDEIPIIGVGGITDEASGRMKYDEGASLLQIYTGLIYHGPRLINRLAKLR